MDALRFTLLAAMALVIAGCQAWQPRDINSLPPTASAPESREPGQVSIRYWMNVPGANPEALTELSRYPDTPDEIADLTSLEQTENRADDYGAMIQGFIVPPQDGLYRFFISADDQAELWLGESQASEPVTRIATVPGWTYQREYDKYSSQTSPPIKLQSGQRYYFQLIIKERSGDDHFAVAWEGPALVQQVISGEFLSSWFRPIYPTDEQSVKAYGTGYSVGFFDGQQGLEFDPQYPPPDEDQDEIYDNWEAFYGLDPGNSADTTSDEDDDFLTASEEFQLGINPEIADTDGDDIPDGAEYAYNLNPRDPQDAAMDSDGDGTSNLEEYLAGTNLNDPEDSPSAPPELTNGFVGQYYAGKSFETFVAYRIDDSIDFTWARSAPMDVVPPDDFTVRWSGTFEAPHTSGNREYEFSIRTDDGVRLYLNSELVIDQWVDRGPTTNTHSTTLNAGETLQIKMEYYEAKIGAVAKLSITNTSTGEKIDQVSTIRSPAPQSESAYDSDGDGLPDSWELRYGTDIGVSDSGTPVETSSNITFLEAYSSDLNPLTLEPVTALEPEAPETSEPTQDETVSTVSLTWTAPDKRTNGDNLTPYEISHYKISYGLSESNLDQETPDIPKDQTTYVIEDLEPGIWYFNIRVYDQDGLASPPSNTEAFQIN